MEAIIHHLSQDIVLKKLVENIPFREPSSESKGVYIDLLGSIISQQLSGKVATVIQNRFLGLFEDGYPHPGLLMELDIETLRSAGLSRQKATYLQNVAAFFSKEKIEKKSWDSMEDDAIIEYLTQIKGVGKWTVEMILMFSLNRPDILPLDDLGIRNAISTLYQLTETGKDLRKKMYEVAEPWRPYRSYACWFLWRYKDAAPKE
jgi:DNA-3-methyladenine glycosylase II